MLYKQRERFKKYTQMFGNIFSKICPYPNIWTAFGIIPAAFTFYFLVRGEFIVAAGVFALTALIDVIDGSVARITNRANNFGAYFDTVVDRLTEFIVLVGIYMVDYPDFFLSTKLWLFLLLFGSLMTTYVKAAAFEKKIVNKEVKGGILERGERMILLFLAILLSAFVPSYVSVLIAITAIVSLVSAVQRFLIAIGQWGFL